MAGILSPNGNALSSSSDASPLDGNSSSNATMHSNHHHSLSINSPNQQQQHSHNGGIDSRTTGSLPTSPMFNGQSSSSAHVAQPVHSQALVDALSTQAFKLDSQVKKSSLTPSTMQQSINASSNSIRPSTAALKTNSTTISAAEADLELQANFDSILNSVVKIFCTSTQPHFSQPWQMRRQQSSTSSGFVISDRLIMTNAHGATDASSIRIRKHGESTRHIARIVHMAHDCDLALLTVDDPQFWLEMKPLELGDVPKLQDTTVVIGYPSGGDNVSVTRGVVSRVIVGTYSHSGESLLSIQIDAAINSGNSGGPVLFGSKVVGVAFEALTSAQSIGYIIPIPVVRHFLTDVKLNGRFTSFPRIPIAWNRCENESLRTSLRMKPTQHGVVVTSIEPLNDAHVKLQKDDVITAVDAHPVADDGTILFRKGERVSFRYIETSKYVNESIQLSILRAGQELQIDLKLESRKSLVPLHLHDKLPSYFVFAGLVFVPLSRSYLYAEFGSEWFKKGPLDLVSDAYYGIKEFEEQEIVVLSQILVDDVTNGYTQMYHNVKVISVNDIKIQNLKHLIQIIESIKDKSTSNSPSSDSATDDDFIRVELDRDRVIVLSMRACQAVNRQILSQNQITFDRSSDLRSAL